MGTRLIRVKTSANVIAGYNDAGSNGTVGVKVANCVDSTGVSTGISVHVTGAFTSSGGSSGSWATSDYHGLTESYWEWAWSSSTNGGGVIELRGFPVGKSVTIGLTGWSLAATRHTDFRVNGVALSRYTNKNVLPPNAPVTIVATADSNGYITITGNFVDSYWYINGLTASYEDQPLISSIDKLESGSTTTVTTSDTSFAATSASITSDTVTKTVSASNAGSGSFTFTPPSWVDGNTALKYDVSNTVTGSDGTTTTQSGTKTLTLPPPYAAVVLTSVSAYSVDKIASLTPAYVIGTQVVYNSAHGKVNLDGTWDDLIWDGEYWVSSGYTGETYLAHRDPTDKIARVGVISIDGGVPAPSDSGLTASGLTHRVFTVSGLTHRGL